MPTIVRQNLFETNSSSTHTLVVSRYDNENHLRNNPIKIKFPFEMYSFGRDGGDFWTDAPHKLAYIWQMLCSQIEFSTEGLSDYELKSSTIPNKIMERFNKFYLLMKLISNEIQKEMNIEFDLSDLTICRGDGDSFYLGSNRESFAESPWMDESIDSAFQISATAKVINGMLDSSSAPNIYQLNKKTGDPEITWDGHTLISFFTSLLCFAFSEKTVIISHGECSDEMEREFEKLMLDYFARNKGYCYVAETEAH